MVGPYGYGRGWRPRGRQYLLIRIALFLVFAAILLATRNNSGLNHRIYVLWGAIGALVFLVALFFGLRRFWTGGFSAKRAEKVERPPDMNTAHHDGGAPHAYPAPSGPIVPPPRSTPGLTWGGETAPSSEPNPPAT